MTTEKHVRYATTVPDLPDAWRFVMGHLDEIKQPRISIEPVTWFYPGEDEVTEYEVSVGGLV